MHAPKLDEATQRSTVRGALLELTKDRDEGRSRRDVVEAATRVVLSRIKEFDAVDRDVRWYSLKEMRRKVVAVLDEMIAGGELVAFGVDVKFQTSPHERVGRPDRGLGRLARLPRVSTVFDETVSGTRVSYTFELEDLESADVLLDLLEERGFGKGGG